MPGKLEVIVGPMRSNKTAELLRRIETRREYARQYVMLLKPSADTKAAGGLVESRNRNGCGKMEAVEFPSHDPWSVLPVIAETEQRIGKRVDCIAIDEGQFVHEVFLSRVSDTTVPTAEFSFASFQIGRMRLNYLIVEFFPPRCPRMSASSGYPDKAGDICSVIRRQNEFGDYTISKDASITLAFSIRGTDCSGARSEQPSLARLVWSLHVIDSRLLGDIFRCVGLPAIRNASAPCHPVSSTLAFVVWSIEDRIVSPRFPLRM